MDFKAKKGSKNVAEILKNTADFRKDFFKANKLLLALIKLDMYIKHKGQSIIKGEVEHIFPKNGKLQIIRAGMNKMPKNF